MTDDKTATPESQTLTWEHDLTLATNPFLWWDFFRVVGVCLLIMELLVFLMSVIVGDPIWLPLWVLGLVAGIFAGLFLIATLLLYGNRYHARFVVDSKGVQMEDAGQGRWFRLRMILLGILAGQPGAVLGSTSGPSGYGERVPWRDVRRVTVHRRLKVVTLNSSWRSMLRLYCPPELFDEVARYTQASVAESERRRIAREARKSAAKKE